MRETAYFTICARNYLAYAITLAESLRSVNSNAEFYIFLADAPIEKGAIDGVTVISIQELGDPDLMRMAFRYTLMEFSTAVKPMCFKHLIQKAGHEKVVYLDPDIQVFSPLTEVEDLLDQGRSAVLTPHLLTPLRDHKEPDDLQILRSGTFNLGFAAFAQCPETEAFLNWWDQKLRTHCFDDVSRGLFVDQKFMEFAPSFLEHLHTLRHPGYNVAYWNLLNREVTATDERWQVNNQPLVFFHFSGISPTDEDTFSKHQSRFDNTNLGDVKELAAYYRSMLMKNGHEHWREVPYAFGTFEDGSSILTPMRRFDEMPGNPSEWFKQPNFDYWNGLTDRVDQDGELGITRLMFALYQLRPDLKETYSLAIKSGRTGFRNWFVTHGSSEYKLSDKFILPALGNGHMKRLRLLKRKTHALIRK